MAGEFAAQCHVECSGAESRNLFPATRAMLSRVQSFISERRFLRSAVASVEMTGLRIGTTRKEW